MNTDSSVRERRVSPHPTRVLNRFRELMIERQAELRRSSQGLSRSALKKAGERGADDSSVTDDAADLAAEVTEQNVSIEMLSRVQAELEEILRALERIDERSYGCCDQCGKAIPEARLEAIPTAATCIECKAASEKE